MQILIDQVKGLDQRIEETADDEEQRQLNDIKGKTLILLESVKHTIVLLQIAKVTTSFPCLLNEEIFSPVVVILVPACVFVFVFVAASSCSFLTPCNVRLPFLFSSLPNDVKQILIHLRTKGKRKERSRMTNR